MNANLAMPTVSPALRPPAEEGGADLARIVGAHRERLARYAGRLLGDWDRGRDVAQDAIIRALEQPPGSLAGREVEWLYTVARNRAIDLLRRRAETSGTIEDGDVADETVHPAAGLEHVEQRQRLLHLIGRLPPNQQEVLRLKFHEGFRYKEIARITGLSAGNVGFLIHTAVSQLRREMAASRQQEERQ